MKEGLIMNIDNKHNTLHKFLILLISMAFIFTGIMQISSQAFAKETNINTEKADKKADRKSVV